MNRLDAKNLNYLTLIKSQQDADGFIESQECDSILFSGLVGCIPGVQVNLDAAFDTASGQWHRRPCSKPCFPEHSKSTISKDMLLGILWYAYHNKRLDISEKIIQTAIGNFGIMGQAVNLKTLLGRCLISPSLLGTAAWVSYRLGGPSRPILRAIPQVESKDLIGYQAHLSVLHVMLRNELTGKQGNKDVLEHHYARNNYNPLFCLATGRDDEAGIALMNGAFWPTRTLPTTRDRREPWLLQRDFDQSWTPDYTSAYKIHSGGDFLFCYWILNRKR
jgi:hypothetical protein